MRDRSVNMMETAETPSAPSEAEGVKVKKKVKNDQVEYASLLQRSGAWLIDAIIVVALAMFFLALIILMTGVLIDSIPNDLIIVYTVLACSVVGFIYAMLFALFGNGATLGKLIMNIRTVNEDFKDANLTQYALDNIIKFSPFVVIDIIVGLIMNSGHIDKRVRATQNISKTVVIKV
jgi:uncharacterized RDD family membrane protein YckC